MFFFAYLMVFFFISGAPLMAQTPPLELRSCWALWDPYQYQIFVEGQQPLLTGLDIRLAQKIAQIAGMRISYEMMIWTDQLKALKEGTKDLANGAMYSKERAEIYHYSIPYRHQQKALFFLRDNPLGLHFDTTEEMLEQFKKKKFRLGVTPGEQYANRPSAKFRICFFG